MKVIIAKSEIISLEGITRVSKIIEGTGSKSNPFRYSLRLEYDHRKNTEIIPNLTVEEMSRLFLNIFNMLSDSNPNTLIL